MAVRVIQNVDVASGDARLSKEYAEVATAEDVTNAVDSLKNKLETQLNGLELEIKRLKNEKITEEELSKAKEKLLGNYILAQETNLEKASLTGGYEALELGYDFGEKYIELINSVTPDDILKAANKYFNDNYILSVVTK